LIHRDIKPANILYVRGEPRLGDIGLVTAMAPSEGRVSFLGTKGYMAPEGPGTASADVYSLGKLLYVVTTGSEPDAFPVLPGNVDQRPDRALLLRLNEVWLKACEPQAAQRMATAGEWMAALGAVAKSPEAEP
jgi:serine/threonine protein kinase